MELYEDQFDEARDFPPYEGPSKVLVIASTGRCGSHMLGHALQRTGCFGFPLEYANPTNRPGWEKRFGRQSTEQLMADLRRRRTSPNGVFGIKIHHAHVREFGGFDGVRRTFPDARYVILTRGNVLGQAVSFSLAKQTGVWIEGQPVVNENPQYDFQDIDRCLRQTILENASWRYLLASHGVPFIEMDFDGVLRDLEGSIRRLAGFLEIEVPDESIPRQQVTKRQSKSINREWTERFLADHGGEELLGDKLMTLQAKLLPTIRAKLRGKG